LALSARIAPVSLNEKPASRAFVPSPDGYLDVESRARERERPREKDGVRGGVEGERESNRKEE
jgi:hypothetical protein